MSRIVLKATRRIINALGLRAWIREAFKKPGVARVMIPVANILFRRVPNYRLELAKSERTADEPLLRSILDKKYPSYTPVKGRVVLAINTLGPGGAERQLVNTAIGLKADKNLDVIVACDDFLDNHPELHGFYVADLDKAEIDIIELNRKDSSVPPSHWSDETSNDFHRAVGNHAALDVYACYNMIRASRPEIVHIFLDWPNVTFGIAAALLGVPKVILSGRNYSPPALGWDDAILKGIYRVLADQPNVRLINNSSAGARDYEKWLELNYGSIKVVHNGISLTKPPVRNTTTRNAARRRLGIAEDGLILGGIFRLRPEKRPELWINSIAIVARRMPELQFLIFGSGSMEREVLALAEQFGVADRLRLFEPVQNFVDIYQAIDGLLLTSAFEGIPNVVLEAQWYGVPVVATAAGGVPESVEDGKTGIVVHSDQPVDIANAVVEILNNAQFSDNAIGGGQAFVAEKFGLDRMIENLVGLYVAD